LPWLNVRDRVKWSSGGNPGRQRGRGHFVPRRVCVFTQVRFHEVVPGRWVQQRERESVGGEVIRIPHWLPRESSKLVKFGHLCESKDSEIDPCSSADGKVGESGAETRRPFHPGFNILRTICTPTNNLMSPWMWTGQQPPSNDNHRQVNLCPSSRLSIAR
jgi:hypothetical protein